MEFFYENHKGETVNLSKPPYILQELDFFNWEFVVGSNGKIENAAKKAREHKCKVAITCSNLDFSPEKRKEKWGHAIEDLYKIITSDVLANKNGKLKTDKGDYLSCRIVASEKNNWIKDSYFVQTDLTILATYPSWITEQSIKITPISDTAASEETGVKTYPYTYPYKYPLLQTETSVYIDHYTDSDFKLTAYGPTTSVLININGYPYEVLYPLEEGEHMIIDSRPQTPKEEKLYVVRANGEKESIFNYRSVENSIFKKIPAGMVKIDYPRTYGVDLIIYKERSEPPWKS